VTSFVVIQIEGESTPNHYGSCPLPGVRTKLAQLRLGPLGQAEPLDQFVQFGTYVNTGELHEITRYIACNAVCCGGLPAYREDPFEAVAPQSVVVAAGFSARHEVTSLRSSLARWSRSG
jgi:hypothetical protein